jgi:N-carbamoyl-L-amino-acid hydrolase
VEPGAAQVLVGSHLDTQPNGGRFDGAYGVLAGLEIVRTLDDRGIRTRRPLTIVSWSNEEGARFPLATTGSSVFSGQLSLEDALAQRAVDGPTFGAELARLRAAGGEEVGARPVCCYLEVHIEQGPLLEASGSAIGIVTRSQGLHAVEVVLTGSALHAGTTPMELRRDALVGAARIVELVSELGRAAGGLGTVGHLLVEPNSRSVIPGSVRLVVDLRHPDVAALDTMAARARDGIEAIARDARLEVELDTLLRVDPVAFDEEGNRVLAEAAARLDLASLELVSGAVHDAVKLAPVVPATLTFVPCRGGVSHNPGEYASPEHVRAGCDVLLQAALARAEVVP